MDTMHPPTLSLTKAAQHVIRAQEDHLEAMKDTDPDKGWTAVATRTKLRQLLALWEDLTGLSGQEALDYARQVTDNPYRDITAAVAPF